MKVSEGTLRGPKGMTGSAGSGGRCVKEAEPLNEVNWRGSGGGHVGIASDNRVGDSKILIIPLVL